MERGLLVFCKYYTMPKLMSCRVKRSISPPTKNSLGAAKILRRRFAVTQNDIFPNHPTLSFFWTRINADFSKKKRTKFFYQRFQRSSASHFKNCQASNFFFTQTPLPTLLPALQTGSYTGCDRSLARRAVLRERLAPRYRRDPSRGSGPRCGWWRGGAR